MSTRHRVFRSVVSGHRLVYCLALAAAVAGALISYLPPLLLRSILDSGVGKQAWDLPAPLSLIVGNGPSAVLTAIVLMVVFSVLAAFLAFVSNFGTQKKAEAMAFKLRKTLFDHIQLLPYEDLSQAPTGDWVQRCTSDVDTLRRVTALQFPELITNLCKALWAIPLLFSIKAELAWYAIPLVPVILIFSIYFFSVVQKAFLKSDESEGRLSGILQENVIGVRVVKAFARQNFESERFERESGHFNRVTRKLINLFAVYWGVASLLSMLQEGIVLMVGINFVVTGKASVGTVVLFLTMTWMLIWPIREMGRILSDLGKAQVSWGRVCEILEKRTEDLGDASGLPGILSLKGRIEFRSVGVLRGSRVVLKDLSFIIEAGTTVGLLGRTGSGKSTLVLLLAGVLDYTGEILLDGTELRRFPKAWLRRQVGLVLQEPHLFAKTIGENISLAHHDVRETEVVEAAKTAALHDVVLSFQHGYQTLLGERGVTLSGGQRQRTAMAQMLLRSKPILVFDDSLSAVDNLTDSEIRKALAEKRQKTPGTVILISHRLSTLAQTDKILVLEDGSVVQSGNHMELIEVDGLYRRMAQLQNALNEEGVN